MMQKTRNGEIEVLRLFFTVAVLLLHSQAVSNGVSRPLFHGGWLGVEFFFLVSGYLMAAYEDRIPCAGEKRVGAETATYIFRKIKNLYPYLFFACIIDFLVWRTFINGVFFPPLSTVDLENFISGFLNFVFPYSLGFKDYTYLGYSWYLSAMIWGMMILFPMLRYNRDLFYCVIAPIFVAFGLGFYSWHYTALAFVSLDNYIFSAGIIRGIAEIAMGCLCYKIAEKMRGGVIFLEKMAKLC